MTPLHYSACEYCAKRTLFATVGKEPDAAKEFANDLQQYHTHSRQVTNVGCNMRPTFIKRVHE